MLTYIISSYHTETILTEAKNNKSHPSNIYDAVIRYLMGENVAFNSDKKPEESNTYFEVGTIEEFAMGADGPGESTLSSNAR
jgi:hypothetical protein